jgi:hypothetical protein
VRENVKPYGGNKNKIKEEEWKRHQAKMKKMKKIHG